MSQSQGISPRKWKVMLHCTTNTAVVFHAAVLVEADTLDEAMDKAVEHVRVHGAPVTLLLGKPPIQLPVIQALPYDIGEPPRENLVDVFTNVPKKGVPN